MVKPDNVKIVQITAVSKVFSDDSSGIYVIGLGDDGQVYDWIEEVPKWNLRA